MGKVRDHKKAYQRRIALAAERGLSRSQARGHARVGEPAIRPNSAKDRDRFEAALKLYRQSRNQTVAAKALNIAPERLRRFLRENVEIEGRGRSLKITDNRNREMKVISNGAITKRVLHGHPDQVRRDYHPALDRPAISRYSATTPELLQWFAPFNDRRDYRDQVKPFGFLFSLSAKLDLGGERIAGRRGPGRPKKLRPIKPTAPFDRDHAKAIALAFDREAGEPVPPSALKSYTDALAHYHIQPESKFLNADYADRGVTLRRHVAMTGTHHIGKESHDWERQALIGLNLDSEIAYGVSSDDLAERLCSFAAEFGERKVAKALGISAAQLIALMSGPPNPRSETLARKIASRLPAAQRLCSKLSHERHAKLHRLREARDRYGLREAARRLGMDPSNLRRRLGSP